METKISEKDIIKINEHKNAIRELNREIAEREFEIKEIILQNGADFQDSYIEYYDARESQYIFMKVEKQVLETYGQRIRLEGPTIALDDNPLTFQDNDDELQGGFYDELNYISVDTEALSKTSASSIRKISKEDMTLVLNYWVETMKEKLFG